jgi:hypothetical protein
VSSGEEGIIKVFPFRNGNAIRMKCFSKINLFFKYISGKHTRDMNHCSGSELLILPHVKIKAPLGSDMCCV